MALRARMKGSQIHPGQPDVPRPKRSTQEVQAERAEKVRLQAEREQLRIKTIKATAALETRMGTQMKEKLTTAHHPPRTTLEKAKRAHSKAQVTLTGQYKCVV